MSLTKFQQKLKDAIQECCCVILVLDCMKPITNNEEVKKWKEQHSKSEIYKHDCTSRETKNRTK